MASNFKVDMSKITFKRKYSLVAAEERNESEVRLMTKLFVRSISPKLILNKSTSIPFLLPHSKPTSFKVEKKVLPEYNTSTCLNQKPYKISIKLNKTFTFKKSPELGPKQVIENKFNKIDQPTASDSIEAKLDQTPPNNSIHNQATIKKAKFISVEKGLRAARNPTLQKTIIDLCSGNYPKDSFNKNSVDTSTDESKVVQADVVKAENDFVQSSHVKSILKTNSGLNQGSRISANIASTGINRKRKVSFSKFKHCIFQTQSKVVSQINL